MGVLLLRGARGPSHSVAARSAAPLAAKPNLTALCHSPLCAQAQAGLSSGGTLPPAPSAAVNPPDRPPPCGRAGCPFPCRMAPGGGFFGFCSHTCAVDAGALPPSAAQRPPKCSFPGCLLPCNQRGDGSGWWAHCSIEHARLDAARAAAQGAAAAAAFNAAAAARGESAPPAAAPQPPAPSGPDLSLFPALDALLARSAGSEVGHERRLGADAPAVALPGLARRP